MVKDMNKGHSSCPTTQRADARKWCLWVWLRSSPHTGPIAYASHSLSDTKLCTDREGNICSHLWTETISPLHPRKTTNHWFWYAKNLTRIPRFPQNPLLHVQYYNFEIKYKPVADPLSQIPTNKQKAEELMTVNNLSMLHNPYKMTDLHKFNGRFSNECSSHNYCQSMNLMTRECYKNPLRHSLITETNSHHSMAWDYKDREFVYLLPCIQKWSRRHMLVINSCLRWVRDLIF